MNIGSIWEIRDKATIDKNVKLLKDNGFVLGLDPFSVCWRLDILPSPLLQQHGFVIYVREKYVSVHEISDKSGDTSFATFPYNGNDHLSLVNSIYTAFNAVQERIKF